MTKKQYQQPTDLQMIIPAIVGWMIILITLAFID